MTEPRGPGRIGRYLLFDALASGGMATVHLGRLMGPVGFSRTVAIKRLHSFLAKQTEFAAMFIDEAKLAARIRHPNVVPILDVVALPSELFLVMEYVEGESLARLLAVEGKRGRGIAPRVASAVLMGVLQGLGAAHEATDELGAPLGLVHRDISPQNILVGVDGLPRVVDFGIAQASQRLQITGSGVVKGKLEYMSREQVCYERVDLRTDIYAASVVLWEALTGQNLFSGPNPLVVKQQVMAGVQHAPSTYAPEVSPALDAIVMRGLSLEASQRFQTAAEMAAALEATGGLASQREVSEWVKETAAPVLAARAEMVARVEAWSESSTSRSHRVRDLDEIEEPKGTAVEDLASRVRAGDPTDESSLTRATADGLTAATSSARAEPAAQPTAAHGAARQGARAQTQSTAAHAKTQVTAAPVVEAPTMAATPIARQAKVVDATQTLVVKKRSRRTWIPTVLAGVASLVVILSLVAKLAITEQEPSSIESASSASAAVPVPTPEAAPVEQPTASVPAEASTAASVSDLPIVSASSTTNSTPAKVPGGPFRTAVPSAKPPPVSCDPPYTIDNMGVRVPKRDCFGM